MPSSVQRFEALEGWRGIACLMVLAYHCGVNLREPPFALFGYCGVHLFFVLSGYLLFRPFAGSIARGERTPDVANFYARRLLRILPPYLVSLGIFVVLRIATGVNVPTLWNAIAHVLLLFNLDPRLDFFSINGVLWSLAIELQFYLLLPAICLACAAVFRGARSSTVLAACVALPLALGIASRAVELVALDEVYDHIANADHVRYRTPFAYLDLFAFGMMVAAICMSPPTLRRLSFDLRIVRWIAAVVGLALIVAANDWAAISTGGAWQSEGPFAFVLLFPVVLCAGIATLLLAIVATPNGGPTWMTWTPLRKTGEISYSLYLYHAGVQFAVFKFGLFQSYSYNVMAVGNAIVSLVPAWIVAWGMYRLVEQPTLRLVARIRSRTQPGRSEAADESPTRAAQPISLLAP